MPIAVCSCCVSSLQPQQQSRTEEDMKKQLDDWAKYVCSLPTYDYATLLS